MPQASDDLRAQFPEYDDEAWAVLAKAGFTHCRGVIRSPQHHRWSQRERDAVDYLCDEWDWAYEGPQESPTTQEPPHD